MARSGQLEDNVGRSTPTRDAESAFFSLMRSHLRELEPSEERARIKRIGSETLHAFQKLANVRRAVSIFGSAQTRLARRWEEPARQTAALLASAGFAVITGGGPGLMQAANEGAKGAGGPSIGLTIDLPTQEAANPHLTLEVRFHYFFLRKLMFVKYACGFVCFPGGFGTLDELFEALNLVRTHKLTPFPVLLFGSAYWAGLLEWLHRTVAGSGGILEEDLNAFEIVDDPAAVVERVQRAYAVLCDSVESAPIQPPSAARQET